MRAYIIKTGDGYLYPFAGDLSLTADESQAGYFRSVDEARGIAQERGYYDGGFEIIAVEVDDALLGGNEGDMPAQGLGLAADSDRRGDKGRQTGG